MRVMRNKIIIQMPVSYRESSTVKDFATNTKVSWKWGEGHGTGYIREKFTDRVVRTINGNEVVRDADEENPAYLLEQDDGQEVLKSASELEKAS